MKEIKGFENYYVDEEGNIYSTKYKKLRRLKPYLDSKKNYLTVTLSRNGINYKRLVHRLVAEAFLDNKLNYLEVNHIDYNTTNNNVSNLEWCNRKQNIKHSLEKNSPIRNFKKCLLYNGDILIGEYISIIEACRVASTMFGVSKSMIAKHHKCKNIRLEIIE